MLPKDLLGLVFGELDHGHDLMNFSEISHRCNQIFHQTLELIKETNCHQEYIVHTLHKKTKKCHGCYRVSLGKSLLIQMNYYHHIPHGRCRHWAWGGRLLEDHTYHYGKKIEN